MFKKLLIALTVSFAVVLLGIGPVMIAHAANAEDTQTNSEGFPLDQAIDEPFNDSGDTALDPANDSESVQLTSISEVSIKVKGASSATINWKVSKANNYLIKYGTDQKKLSNTLFIPIAQTSIDLNDLPAGQQIYFEITPYFEDEVGSTYKGNFKTQAVKANSSNTTSISIIIVGAILLLAGIAFFVRRLLGGKNQFPKMPPRTTPYTNAPQPITTLPNVQSPANKTQQPAIQSSNQPFLPSVLTPEAEKQMQATLERLESQSQWWLPDSGTQKLVANQQAAKMKAQNDVPDMFALGKKRLEDEEKDNLIPKY